MRQLSKKLGSNLLFSPWCCILPACRYINNTAACFSFSFAWFDIDYMIYACQTRQDGEDLLKTIPTCHHNFGYFFFSLVMQISTEHVVCKPPPCTADLYFSPLTQKHWNVHSSVACCSSGGGGKRSYFKTSYSGGMRTCILWGKYLTVWPARTHHRREIDLIIHRKRQHIKKQWWLTRCKCAARVRAHVGVSSREHACVVMALMGERGREEAGERGRYTARRDTERLRAQNNFRRPVG